jgi:hypothetical protein
VHDGRGLPGTGWFGYGFGSMTQQCGHSLGLDPAQPKMGWWEGLAAVLSGSGAQITDDCLGGSRRHEQRGQSGVARCALGVKCVSGKREWLHRVKVSEWLGALKA